MAQRDLTSGMQTEVQAKTLRPVVFFEGAYNSAGSPQVEYLRLWSGLGQILWNGSWWTGGGNMVQISPIEESAAIEALGFVVMISGLPSENISIALQSVRQGMAGKLWLGAMDADNAVIADPYLAQQARFDVVMVEDSGQTCVMKFQYESRLIDLFKPRIRRYTNEDQQVDHSGDLGFDQVPALQDMDLIWGGTAAASAPLATPGGGEDDNIYTPDPGRSD